MSGVTAGVHNPSDDDYQELELLKDIAKYLIVGKEFGEKKTLHYQGYVYFLPRARAGPSQAYAWQLAQLYPLVIYIYIYIYILSI